MDRQGTTYTVIFSFIVTFAFVFLLALTNQATIYAAEFAGGGLWSTIRGVLGVNEDVSRILGLQIISQGETPGLGGRIDEPWFKQQFTDEKIVNGQIQINMHNAGTPDTSHDNGEVDGITGATITSTSVGRIVNDELKTLRSVLGGNS